MKKMLMRPAAALLPCALLLCALLGRSLEVFELLLGYYPVSLCTLCAADAYRNAAAREPSPRGVDRLLGSVLLQMLLGFLLAVLLGWLFLDMDTRLPWLAAAALLNIEHLFVERSYALGRMVDGAITQFITALLLCCALLTGLGEIWHWLLGAVLIAAVSSLVLVKPQTFRVSLKTYAFAPKACVQTLLYPVLTVVLILFTDIHCHMLAALPSLAVWKLSRTVCRRSEDESRRLNLFTLAWAGVPLVICSFVPSFDIGYCLFALTLLLCSAIVFLNLNGRFIVGCALTLAASVPVLFLEPSVLMSVLTLALVLSACILNSKRVLLVKK